MPTDLYKQVKFSDGEGVTHTDLNDLSRFLSAQTYDQILEQLVGNLGLSATLKQLESVGTNSNGAPAHLAYCINGGSAYLRLGTANNRLQIAPGTLLQKVGTSNGNGATFLAYTFSGTEEVTIANGDPTNPRVDIVQMKLELVDTDLQTRDFEDATTHVITSQSFNKKTKVHCTLSVKQGTPAASPTYPDPDTGYVCVAGVVVPANYALPSTLQFGASTDLILPVTAPQVHDQRMPLRVRAHSTHYSQYQKVTAFAENEFNDLVTSSNASNQLNVPCMTNSHIGRVVGFTVAYLSSGVAFTGKLVGSNGGTFRGAITFPASGAGVIAKTYCEIEGNHVSAGYMTINPSPVNKIGPPIWTSGTAVAVPSLGTNPDPNVHRIRLNIQNIANGGAIYNFATWYIAEGL
jgi:hypothetical protein